MKKIRIYLILFNLFLFNSVLHAEIIRGRVLDMESHEPIPDARVNYSRSIVYQGNNVVASTYIYADSLGRFQFFSDIKGDIQIQQIGYYSKVVSYLAVSDSKRDTIDVGEIYLKPSEVMMKMLEVKGRVRRFTVKGDTIIFNPAAFHLQDGARLEELIAKLPGVEVKDGSLTWNGKPIRLTMNGESLFGGSESITQLPIEAVENIKAYNKASEFSERTGKDDGGEDMVLDVKIKKSFLDKWYGDVEAEYQTPKHYMADLLLNHLSESDPVMVTASANDLNRRKRRGIGFGSMDVSKGFGQEQYGAVGYQHNWKRQSGRQSLKSHWTVNAGIAHDDQWQTNFRDVESLFPGQDVNYQSASDYHRNHILNPQVSASARWALDERNTLAASLKAEQKRMRGRQEYRMEERSARQLILRNSNRSNSEERQNLMDAQANWTHYITKGSLAITAELNYRDEDRDEWIQRDYDYMDASPSSTLRQMSHAPLSQLSTSVQGTARRWLGEQVLMNLSYKFNYKHKEAQQDFFTDDQADDANSFDEHFSRMENNIQIGATVKQGSFQLMPQLTWLMLREREDYRRAHIDTSAMRRSIQWLPQLRAVYKLSKVSSMEMSYSLRTRQPEILQTIRFYDDSNPLFTREGNECLKEIHSNDVALNYSFVQAAKQRNVNVGLTFSSSDRDLQDVLTYNPQTAAYHCRPENVKGGKQAGLRFNYEQALGYEFRLKSNLNVRLARTYGYLTLTEDNYTPVLNRKHSLNPMENLSLTYDHQWLQCSAFAIVSMNRLTFSKSPQQNATLWNTSLGASLNFRWRDFSFFTRLTEQMRQGYLISSMNHNYLLWNASVSYTFLKKKAKLSIDVDDILNNQDTFFAQQSAYQNIYSWSEVMHHYLNFSFSYRFDAKEKK